MGFRFGYFWVRGILLVMDSALVLPILRCLFVVVLDTDFRVVLARGCFEVAST